MPISGGSQATPIVGVGKGYRKSEMYALAQDYKNLVDSVMTESTISLYQEPGKAFLDARSRESLKNFFLENALDEAAFDDPADLDDHINMLSEQFNNDARAVLEYNAGAAMNPVLGMTIPIHKNILMNCVFEQGVQKVVATTPKFTETMEFRYLVTPDGDKIDMFRDQMKIGPAIKASNPFVEIEIELPESGTTDILTEIGAASVDNLSIETHISAIQVGVFYAKGEKTPDGETVVDDAGEVVDQWIAVDYKFAPGFHDIGRVMNQRISFGDIPLKDAIKDDLLTATMKDNIITIQSLKGAISAVKLACRKDASNGLLNACTAKWEATSVPVEIPNATPINTAVSPEEVKDINALYQVNHLSKIMEMFNLSLKNYKDDDIRSFLNASYTRLPDTDKIASIFDMKPRGPYALDPVSWRNALFMDEMDTSVTDLLYVLNDPNVVFTVYGRPDIIRKITPTEYTYAAPSSLGNVQLEFDKIVVNASDKRTWQFIGTPKMNNSDELIIIVNPRNTDRIIYRLYDYQLYLSNEIRNQQYFTLPSIHAFERYLMYEYQPVQGRVKVLNPRGYDISDYDGLVKGTAPRV